MTPLNADLVNRINIAVQAFQANRGVKPDAITFPDATMQEFDIRIGDTILGMEVVDGASLGLGPGEHAAIGFKREMGL